jgi:hypothetical protein
MVGELRFAFGYGSNQAWLLEQPSSIMALPPILICNVPQGRKVKASRVVALRDGGIAIETPPKAVRELSGKCHCL